MKKQQQNTGGFTTHIAEPRWQVIASIVIVALLIVVQILVMLNVL